MKEKEMSEFPNEERASLFYCTESPGHVQSGFSCCVKRSDCNGEYKRDRNYLLGRELTEGTVEVYTRRARALVAGRDAVTVADKLLQYNKGGGKVLAGLTRRREEERELFLS